jgi:hypothetical protein
MASEFNLNINTERESIANPYQAISNHSPDEKERETNRRKQVANLLRIVATMLEQGRDIESIKDHSGVKVGSYTLRHF